MKTKTINPLLRALLSIRNHEESLEQHHSQPIQIEKEISDLNKSMSSIIEANCSIESFEKWVSALKTIDRPAFNINRILSVAVEKIATKDFSDSCVLWRKFEFYLCKLKEAYCDLRLLGLKLLNESEYSKWVKNMEEFDNSILPLIVSNAEFCLEELKIIGRYNAKELSQITKTVLKGVPNDFTNDEADNYERDYLVALKDFKQEFHKEKNVWDSFLDILADRSHQSPSENVMMGRWVDGEKGDLK